MIEQKTLQQLALDFVGTRNEKAFTLLHDRLKPGLKKFVQKYHQDTDTVDEILAITLSKAFVYADSYDSRWNFSTWIYKICQNECLMEIRRKNSLSSLDYMVDNKIALRAVNSDDWKTESDYEFFEQPETMYADSVYSEVLDEIKNLPEHYKEVISDRILEKMKYKDIAEKRNLKINTVRSRIHSAKKVIKGLWLEKKKDNSNKSINIVGVTVLDLLDKHPSDVSNKLDRIQTEEAQGRNYKKVGNKTLYDTIDIKRDSLLNEGIHEDAVEVWFKLWSMIEPHVKAYGGSINFASTATTIKLPGAPHGFWFYCKNPAKKMQGMRMWISWGPAHTYEDMSSIMKDLKIEENDEMVVNKNGGYIFEIKLSQLLGKDKYSEFLIAIMNKLFSRLKEASK
jgi:RNA polymerase sigma-70 factor (ECF subfamily)